MGRGQNCTYATVALVAGLAIGTGLSKVDIKNKIRASLSFKLAPHWINGSNERQINILSPLVDFGNPPNLP